MCRYILLDSYKEKGKIWLVLYDRHQQYLFVEPLWRFRMKFSFYREQGIERR